MLFYSIFICLILSVQKTSSFLQIDFNTEFECLVRVDTEYGQDTCFNHQCTDFKDLWRIVTVYRRDEPCTLHYLTLAFSTYDQFLLFVEAQHASNHSLASFFAHSDSKLTMLEISIDNIYPFNPKYFLSESMLQKLGGEDGRIAILQMEIKKWFHSNRTQTQLIDNDLITRQSIDQITVFFRCQASQKVDRFFLAKYMRYQERSSCPDQIKIVPEMDFSKKDYSFEDTTPVVVVEPPKEENKWHLFTKIAIFLVIVSLIIAFLVYYFMYSSSSKK